jgi:UDP-N-acetylmuramoyl-tripeptide--D-alanyl-D-alanine ligase
MKLQYLLAIFGLLLFIPQSLRWARVSQREHYIPGSNIRFAYLWWTTTSENIALMSLSAALTLAGIFWLPAQAGAIVIAAIGPIGLSLRPKTKPLEFTRRLKLTMGVSYALALGFSAFLAFIIPQGIDLIDVFSFELFDLALLILNPLEQRLSKKYVLSATKKLADIKPKIVAITGSFGKTTTKHLLSQLLSKKFVTFATPLSYNNNLGIAKAINEAMPADTEVFLAEMGTYKKGEIKQMCDWIKPQYAAFLSVGNVHLERFGSIENIVKAKSEIFEYADKIFLNADFELIRELSKLYPDKEAIVVTNERQNLADSNFGVIKVRDTDDKSSYEIYLDHRLVAGDVTCNSTIPELSIGFAIAIGFVLGVPIESMIKELPELKSYKNRGEVIEAESGITVIDNTFNSNEYSIKRSIKNAKNFIKEGGKVVVVTPGLVELGKSSKDIHKELAAYIKEEGCDLVIIGRTNKKALLSGYPEAICFIYISEGVSYVNKTYKKGDVVIYENDLPDHYP